MKEVGHKIRTMDGKIGWIKIHLLELIYIIGIEIRLDCPENCCQYEFDGRNELEWCELFI